MKRTLLSVVVLMCLAVGSIHACGYGAMPNPTIIFAQADAVLVGKVVWLEDKLQPMKLHPNNPTMHDMQIAIVEVQEGLKGTNQLTHLRVAFHSTASIARGDEALFTLFRHGSEPVYLLQLVEQLPNKNDKSAKNPLGRRLVDQLPQLRKLSKMWNNPVESLSCGPIEDRMLATALVLYQAQTANSWDHAANKTGVLDRTLSRHVLKNIGEADWNNVNFANAQISAGTLFHMLKATPKDGWDQLAVSRQHPKDGGMAAAKAWCKASADSFQISAIVRAE